MATVFYAGQSDYIKELNILADRINEASDVGAYSERVDYVNDNLFYRGQATVGSAESSPVWRIRRITIDNNEDVTTDWADSNANFDNTWDSRAAKLYG